MLVRVRCRYLIFEFGEEPRIKPIMGFCSNPSSTMFVVFVPICIVVVLEKINKQTNKSRHSRPKGANKNYSKHNSTKLLKT